MAKKPTQTSRKSRFELLEDRRLLTTWNVAAKFNANGSGDGGEAAFGDNATKTATQLSSTFNNNYGTGAHSASDTATGTSPWDFGGLDSGQAAYNASTPYAFGSTYVDPNSFDNFLNGAATAPWAPGFPGAVSDGVAIPGGSYDGYVGFSGGPTGNNAIFYDFGNSGLNGDGSGNATPDVVAEIVNIPTGTVAISPGYGPSVAQFVAPAAGNYVLSVTLTNPFFDPYDGPGGPNGDDQWSWTDGQADYAIFKVPASSSDAHDTSAILDDGFYTDIASVNQADIPTPGNSINASSGLTINPAGGAGGQGPGGVYGSGGTWSLSNVGAISGPAGTPGTDTSGDEFHMQWTVTQTVTLGAGDAIDIAVNPEYNNANTSHTDASGDLTTPIYIAATVSNAPIAPAPPVVTASGSTGHTFTVGGSAVAVDSGISVTSTDMDITGASMTITNFQSGDSLSYTPSGPISIASNSGGVLSLTGSATPAQYQAALQSVTFSTTSVNQTTRSIAVVATDSSALPTNSNTATDTVNVAVAAPVVTAHQTSVNATAGQTISADSAVTVSSFDTDVTGAVVTISANFQSGDTFHFTAQNGITIASNTGGVLSLTGSATPAQYQTALQSITYSSTSTSTATRTVSYVVKDSGDTGNVNSNTATTNIVVSAPITITAAYVAGTAWSNTGATTNYNGYLVSHSLGDATIPTVGYALRTGAAQLTTLPWNNVNKISVTFSGAVSNIGLGSLELLGGTGSGAVAAPSVTGFTSDGSNTYSWTLASALGNNKYVFAIATTNTTSFGTSGTRVTDANGAGISGAFTTSSSSFPSGNGLAGGTFDFFFDLLPGDGNQNGTNSTADTTLARQEANDRTNSAGYNPYVDYNGAGQISTATLAVDLTHPNLHNSTLVAPSAPSGVQVGGTSFTALALGVQESGSSSSSSSTPVNNVIPAATTSTTPSTGTGSNSGSGGSGGSGSGSSTTSTRDHGRHSFAATDEAVSDFDLADLFA